ncbi:F0F1 ATP synthase subunit delta [Streptococcus sp. sy004]|uniref:F0F1 ATP synthase subunit delta n=1 Tax=Streptococcus sp. sy004 TaxID=2600149 RepID=UPI0011B77688|nr:F0F1 ATP synthase subunit delta [Streptococcus sp. sy004]TWT12284.1 F0F1 ATP synthase subunit delta [Streptococcus sp. sy004]
MKQVIEQYAKSIVEVATEKNCLSQLDQELSNFIQLGQEHQLPSLLARQSYDRQAKIKLVRLFQESSSVYLKNFLEVILQNEREALLFPIFETALAKINQLRGSFDVHLTSAQALSDKQKQRLLKMVKHKFDLEPRQLIEHIDPSLIGGFIVSANNKVLDTSIRRQLQDFKLKLK